MEIRVKWRERKLGDSLWEAIHNDESTCKCCHCKIKVENLSYPGSGYRGYGIDAYEILIDNVYYGFICHDCGFPVENKVNSLVNSMAENIKNTLWGLLIKQGEKNND